MEIVRFGRPCCGIDAPANAPEPVRYAAGELSRFIEKKTGCVLPAGSLDGRAIVLRMVRDDDRFKQLFTGAAKAESYAVDCDDDHVYLVGADAAGVVYAVFDFLATEVGIGFGGLGELGIRLHRDSSLVVSVRERCCAPEFPYRGLQGAIREDAVEAAGGISPLHVQRLDWMAQNRMNYYLVDPGCHEGFDQIRKLIPEVKRRGLKVMWAHHGWNRWVPPEKYYEKHPEYFMLVDGEHKGREWHPQLCLCTSNPDVARAFASEVLAVLDENPDIDAISLWPNDGEGMCQCDECKKLDQLPDGHTWDRVPGTDKNNPRSRRHPNKTVRYALFVNEIARIVGEVRPDVALSALFYYDIDAPPKGVTLEPNVQPVLAHYWRCWRHPLDHPRCENTYFERITGEWARQYPDRLVIYEYLMGMSWYSSLPWPIIPTMRGDWKRYRQMGIAGATIQSQASHFTVYGPTYSAFARMCWELDVDPADLSRPYYDNLYEESAPPIARMMSMLEERMQSDDCAPKDGVSIMQTEFTTESVYSECFLTCVHPNPESVTLLLDEDVISRIDRHVAEAQSLAAQDRTRTNVDKLRTAANYWKLAYRFFEALNEARRHSQDGSAETGKWIEQSLRRCDEIITFLEHIPYPDVVAREMILRNYWPRFHRALAAREKSPHGDMDVGGKWP